MNFSPRNIIIGIVVLILAVAVPVTIRLAQQQQQLKSQAAGMLEPAPVGPYPCDRPTQPKVGDIVGRCNNPPDSRGCYQTAYAKWLYTTVGQNGPQGGDSANPNNQPWCDSSNCSSFYDQCPAPPVVLSGTITLASSTITYGGTIAGTVSANNVPWRVSLCSDATRTNCSATSNNWTQLGSGSGNGNFSYGPANTTGTYAVALLDPNTNAIANQTTVTINPAGGGGGGNVGVGGVDVADCSSITIDGLSIEDHPGLVKDHEYQVQITMSNSRVQTPQNDWKSNYYLLYTGSSKQQLGISDTKINVPNPPVGVGQSRLFPVTIKPTAGSSGSGFEFYWQMYNEKNEPFLQGRSGKCTPKLKVFSTLPGGGTPPPSTQCPVGASAGFIGGVDRTYQCKPEGTIGCISSSNTPPYQGVSASQLTCTTTGTACLACSSDTTLNNFPFNQCGACKNNPQTQAQDPKCENPAATRDDEDSRCSVRRTIGTKKIKDICIDTSCVGATTFRDCGYCFGTNCQVDPELCTDSAKPVCVTTGAQKGFCVAEGAIPTPTPSGGGSLACTRFELSGLTKSNTKNSEGGPIYTSVSSGGNNPFELTFTPKNATVILAATTQTTGAPDLTITETNTGSSIVRVANIPSNTSDTQDNSYLIRATVDDGIQQVSCLPIQVIVPKIGAGGTTAATCPGDIQSTEVKFKNADNTGDWIKERTITLGQSIKAGGFHNGQTPDTPPLDVELSYVGPKGVTSPPVANGGIFTPSSDPNVGPGAYVFTGTTAGKTGAKCSGMATLVVNAVPTPTPTPTPAPVKKTLCFAFGEGPEGKIAVDGVKDCSNIDNKLVFPYTSEPAKINGYAFKDQTPGVKTIFVKFIGILGTTPVFDSKQLSIRYNPNPAISNVSCTHSSSGVGTDIKIIGTSFGAQGKGKVKVGGQELTPDSWDGTTNTITGKLDQRLEGKIGVEVTTDDGRSAKGECVVNTTTVTFKTMLQCKSAGSFAASNVDIKVFEAVPLSTDAKAPEPILRQKISLNKDGEPQNFAPKFEKKKKYQLIIKAPGTIARRVDFDTKDGGTTNLEGSITLPQGDVAPANSPDGKINALDKSELIRQWNIVTDVAKSADLNGDSRVNSIDYACMRVNFNATDDTYSAPTASTSPTPAPSVSASPTPTPSSSPSPTPTPSPSPTPTPSPTPGGGGTGGTTFRISFDPLFPAGSIQQGTIDPITGEAIIDITLPEGAGVKNVYVQFSEDGGVSWGPTPPTVATITLI